MSENNGMTSQNVNAIEDFNWEEWLENTFKETDDKIIEDANKSVDEELRLDVNDNVGLDNELVNLSRASITGNEAAPVVSQSPHREPATEQLLEANDQDGVFKQTQDGEQTATSPAELPAYIEGLLEKNGPSISRNEATPVVYQSTHRESATEQLLEANDQDGVFKQTQDGEQTATSPAELPAYIKELLEKDVPSISQTEVIAVGCRDSNKKARRKSFPKPSEVHQPPAELPTLKEGLLESTTCISGKRKTECNGQSKSKKRGSKAMVDSIATNQQFPHKEDIKNKRRKERERLRAKENRAKKKQLDAYNDAKRHSLDKEVNSLRGLIAEKEEMTKHLEHQNAIKDSEIERLQHEKDLEIVYLKKKIERLEYELEEKNAKIVLLENKLEFRT